MTDETAQPKLCLIVVNWNGKHHLEECLSSLRDMAYDNHVTLFVDNGSTDGSVECVRHQFPECEVIANRTNIGAYGGTNLGLRWALARDFDYIGSVDNDAVVAPDYAAILVNHLEENPDVGLAAPTVAYYDAPNRVQHMGGTISLYLWRATLNGQGRRTEEALRESPRSVDWAARGMCIASRAAIEAVGLTDEGFPRGGDIDWSLRFHRAGFEVVCVPQAVMWHKVSQIITEHSFAWWSFRNMWVYFRRYGSLRHWVAVPIALAVQIGKLALRPLWQRYMSWKLGVRVGSRDEIQHVKQASDNSTLKQT